MKNAKWILPLAALFALPAFAQPLSLEDAVSAEVKAQMYESQVAETSGASATMQTDNSGAGSLTAEDMRASPSAQGDMSAGKADSALPAKEPAAEPDVAANERASVSTEHPQKPASQPEHKRVHVVRHIKKKAVR